MNVHIPSRSTVVGADPVHLKCRTFARWSPAPCVPESSSFNTLGTGASAGMVSRCSVKYEPGMGLGPNHPMPRAVNGVEYMWPLTGVDKGGIGRASCRER